MGENRLCAGLGPGGGSLHLEVTLDWQDNVITEKLEEELDGSKGEALSFPI